jgi:purine-binding chemotaxis protein CheW
MADTTFTDDDLIQLVSFHLGEELFGIDILRVQEINRMVDITRVPQAPTYCEGVINLRGKVIPVIDLRIKFDLPVAERDKNTRIVVCDVDGGIVGMLVDAVDEVLRIPGTTIEPAPSVVTSIHSEYIQGVAKLDGRLLIFLDIAGIADEVSQFAHAGEEVAV